MLHVMYKEVHHCRTDRQTGKCIVIEPRTRKPMNILDQIKALPDTDSTGEALFVKYLVTDLKALAESHERLLAAMKIARDKARDIIDITGADMPGGYDNYGETEIFKTLKEAIEQAEKL